MTDPAGSFNTLGLRSIELEQSHTAWIHREQERQRAVEDTTLIKWTRKPHRFAKPAPPPSPWSPDGCLLPSSLPLPTPQSTDPPTPPRKKNRMPSSPRSPPPPPDPPKPTSTTRESFDDFLIRQNDAHKNRDETAAKYANEERPLKSMINSNSKRIVKSHSRSMVQRRPPSSEEEPPMEEMRSPRKQSAIDGERRFQIEIAQAAIHELNVEALRLEVEGKKMKECTFTPKFISKEPPRRLRTKGVKKEEDGKNEEVKGKGKRFVRNQSRKRGRSVQEKKSSK
jgi:hypothetical protein